MPEELDPQLLDYLSQRNYFDAEDAAQQQRLVEHFVQQGTGQVAADYALLAGLKAEYEADREFTTEWYAVRWERLHAYLQGTEHFDAACHIMANGTVDGQDPPTYAQCLNRTRRRAERAEKALAVTQTENTRLRKSLAGMLESYDLLTREALEHFQNPVLHGVVTGAFLQEPARARELLASEGEGDA